MKSDFMVALKQLAAERHLPMEQVLGAIEVALASAFKKDNPASGQNITVTLNPNSGEVSVYALKTVVETVADPEREITVHDAKRIKKTAALGDEVAAAEPLPHNASRIAAQTAKQVVLQRLREAERELLYQEFAQHEGDIMSGVVETSDSGRAVTLDLGRAQAILPQDEQVNSERYRKGQRVKVYLLSVRHGSKGPEIIASRSHRDMLRRLFEIEVPEVFNGIVEIKGIAREAGLRSKVAVSANQPGIDPVGSCIGIRGNRIQSIVNELQGEKIDIVSWDADPRAFIANSLSPSEPVQVELMQTEQTAVVVVPDRQLSLAIGKEGQNTRLAARLTGWRLDIKGMAEWEQIREARLQAAAEAAARAAAEGAARAKAKAAEQAAAAQEAEPAVAPVAADAVAETAAEATVAEAAPIASPETPETPETMPVTTDPATMPVTMDDEAVIPELAVSPLDEETILEALIREEDAQQQMQQTAAEPLDISVGISVDDLESFTLEDVPVADVEEEDDDGEEDEAPFDVVEMPVLTPDAGKIRFAEDIVEDIRGGGRRGGGRARRGGGGGGGSRRR